MQIRLTVLASPPGGQAAPRACDVLVTAPAGTALAAVASGLASAVSGADASAGVVLYAGGERLDVQRRVLGEPPLVDGAVLTLQVPGEDHAPPDGAPARLHVVAGPDAGGVHLLHGGEIRIGRSADADVPLDDPDVSRLHCAVTVAEDGRVAVADLGSTNGTTLDGAPVGPRPVRLAPGALLRLGESSLRLATGPSPDGPPLPTTPDGEGRLRVHLPSVPEQPGRADRSDAAERGADRAGEAVRRPGPPPAAPRTGVPIAAGAEPVIRVRVPHQSAPRPDGAGPSHGPASGTHGPASDIYGPASGSPGPASDYRPDASGTHGPASDTHGPASGSHGPVSGFHPDAAGTASGTGRTTAAAPSARPVDPRSAMTHTTPTPQAPADHSAPSDPRRAVSGTHRVDSGPDVLPPATEAAGPRRRGIGAWARRLAGGREEAVAGPGAAPERGTAPGAVPHPADGPGADTWPDPAAVLLTALGPGPRLWERGPGHPEELVVRLGTSDRAELAAVPVTVGLREAGALGLAGPRARLLGLARSVVAQLTALHAPGGLELVVVAGAARGRDWSWLGWLPQLRPTQGQDCRLLLAYDREQAAARTGELVRRLDDGPLGPGWASADRAAVAEAAARYEGPRTVLVVDGDPGSAALRETTARLAAAGAASGIHLICLAETPAASPASPVDATYETACAASLPFRECGAAALLSGDVATALRLLRTAGGRPAGHGTVGTVDAVSAAWAERFARALAPLGTDEPDGGTGLPGGRRAAAVALPPSARLLDELGLARATPASLMARWASAPDGTAVLGAGPRGPVTVDLTVEGPHLLVEGPAASGRTELLRAVAASLAAASRPDRLGLLLVDGAGAGRGEGLAPCTELPHATQHLVASDPVRMREFAQALGAELKRRAELLGRQEFTEWHQQRELAERMVGQRRPGGQGGGDLDAPPTGTLRLRPAARGAEREVPPPLPRLVVLVDDYDALVAPALGAPGRPAAGSVVRALEAVARDGHRLGVHLVAASARPDRTADTELVRGARLRVVLDAPAGGPGPDSPAPGRGRLGHPDGRVTPFQGGRVTGRIPRTATQRPTVVPLDWARMGDPPTRRPVRELGNGPTDLALLASALDRAARSVNATPLPPLVPTAPSGRA
ncbi:FHA domain-containing protein [Streptomyces lichenis]|uniref:FHA domain-containing protein n=1 Tax=Streptomyces lichenis TaxID=2306967 RepID=A0ABT0I5Y3_9ACTN|nr:FHA domain-containing protein [Streptomyces lichenis]MCK8676707.1 FHA domain-containing protein [Streptomyces lichenis]